MSDQPEKGRVFTLHKSKGVGPVHWLQDEHSFSPSWCGQRPQFRHVTRDGTIDEVTCKTCLRRIKIGHPLAVGAR